MKRDAESARSSVSTPCERMVPPVLDVSDLRKVYADGTRALRGASFRVEGGVVGLLGENGAGKSTLLSIVSLELQATSGTVRHRGLDVARPRDRPRILRGLGYLPQSFEPVRTLTGWEYLAHCARLRGVDLPARRLAERIGELLEAVDLDAWAHRPTGEYSGGMKRRLGVCQALVHEPGFVVLDEPSAGLDPEQRILLRNFVAEVGRSRTVLLSSHVVDDIDQTCSRMVVLAAGTVLYEGSPGELIRRYGPCLWEVPETAAEEVPRAAAGHLLGFVGENTRVVYAESPPPHGRPRRATLEEAYGALLVSPPPLPA
jgi:ABC-2 type transport system ATP-binding protein